MPETVQEQRISRLVSGLQSLDNVERGDEIQFELHPDHLVEYLGRLFPGAKMVNTVWYFRNDSAYEPFPEQSAVRLLQR